MREIVLDTETTGLDPSTGDRIVEIGCVELMNHLATGKTYHVYLNPERAIDPGAVAIHGLTDEFLADKPKFRDIASEFVEFVRDAQLVATMRFFAERMKMVVEPTGCLGAAAALQGVLDLRGQRVGIILSGGNVDLATFAGYLAG